VSAANPDTQPPSPRQRPPIHDKPYHGFSPWTDHAHTARRRSGLCVPPSLRGRDAHGAKGGSFQRRFVGQCAPAIGVACARFFAGEGCSWCDATIVPPQASGLSAVRVRRRRKGGIRGPHGCKLVLLAGRVIMRNRKAGTSGVFRPFRADVEKGGPSGPGALPRAAMFCPFGAWDGLSSLAGHPRGHGGLKGGRLCGARWWEVRCFAPSGLVWKEGRAPETRGVAPGCDVLPLRGVGWVVSPGGASEGALWAKGGRLCGARWWEVRCFAPSGLLWKQGRAPETRGVAPG